MNNQQSDLHTTIGVHDPRRGLHKKMTPWYLQLYENGKLYLVFQISMNTIIEIIQHPYYEMRFMVFVVNYCCTQMLVAQKYYTIRKYCSLCTFNAYSRDFAIYRSS